MNKTYHYHQRELQRTGNLNMNECITQYFPNPRYPNQDYKIEFYSNGTRVIPIDRRTGAEITMMTNTNGTLDGVSIGLRDFYKLGYTYDEDSLTPAAPMRQYNDSIPEDI